MQVRRHVIGTWSSAKTIPHSGYEREIVDIETTDTGSSGASDSETSVESLGRCHQSVEHLCRHVSPSHLPVHLWNTSLANYYSSSTFVNIPPPPGLGEVLQSPQVQSSRFPDNRVHMSILPEAQRQRCVDWQHQLHSESSARTTPCRQGQNVSCILSQAKGRALPLRVKFSAKHRAHPMPHLDPFMPTKKRSAFTKEFGNETASTCRHFVQNEPVEKEVSHFLLQPFSLDVL